MNKIQNAANAKSSYQGLDEYNLSDAEMETSNLLLSDNDDDDAKYNHFNGNGHMNGNGTHTLRLAAKTKAARMALRNNNNWTASPIQNEEEEINSPAYNLRNKDVPTHYSDDDDDQMK